MRLKIKLVIGEVISNPKARTIFILSMLLLAALAGSAPSDYGG